MRLINCHIENFGKLSDCTFDFTDKENIICQENGWGKSTFAAFVRAIFYGLEGKSKHKIEENEFARYKPWQGGVFGGSLTFEAGGKQYTVTRNFDAKGVFELRDAKTNLISTDFSEKLGEELFKVDRAAFMRTVFIGQNDCPTKTTDDINAKIGNLTDNTNDLNSYEKADKALANILNKLNPNNARGSINKRTNEIAELQHKVTDGESIERSIEEYQRYLQEETEKCETLKREYEEAAKMQTQVSKQQKALAKKEEWINLKKTCGIRNATLETAKAKFPGEIPQLPETDGKLATAIAMERAAERLNLYAMSDAEREELSNLETAFRDSVPDEEKIEELQESVRILRKQKEVLAKKQNELHTQRAIESALSKSGKKAPVLPVVGILAVLAGIFLVITDFLIPGIAVAIVGLSIAAAGFFGGKKEKEPEVMPEIKRLQTEIEDTETEISKICKEVTDYLERYGRALGTYSNEERFADDLYLLKTKISDFVRLQQKKNHLANAKAEYEKLHESVCLYLEMFHYQPSEKIREQLDTIKENIREYETAVKLDGEAKEALKRFEEETDMAALTESLSEETLPSPEELNKKMTELVDEMEESRKAIHGYNNELDSLQEKYDEWEEEKVRLNELQKLQAEEQKKYDCINKTKLYLGMAKESMTAKYAGPILASFKKYYEMITENQASQYRIDANTNITVEELGLQRETNTLSFGYQDLVGICLRVALVDAMYTQELPMLIMDDPFTNLDDEKMVAAKRFLKEIAEKYQVLYFTCSEARS